MACLNLVEPPAIEVSRPFHDVIIQARTNGAFTNVFLNLPQPSAHRCGRGEQLMVMVILYFLK